jgi:predicted transposase/invertase (TIGR01784 family)
MKSDSLFYKYFQMLPEALLLLADEDIPSQTAAEYRFQSVEVKDLSFRLDGVLARADFEGVFFFVEVQYQKDKHLYRRIFAEIMVFLAQNRPQGRWRVVVVFPKRSIDAGLPDDYAEYLASGRLKIVYLNELSNEKTKDFPLNLLHIMQAAPRKDAIASAVEAVLNAPIEGAKREEVFRLVRGMIATKLPTLTFEEIRAMIEPTMSALEQTQYYRDLQAMQERSKLEGKLEGIRAAAYNFLRMGISVAQVMEATGLTLEEVNALQQ